MSENYKAPRKEGKVQVVKNNKAVWISEDEYNEDNLQYHALVHTLSVCSEKIDNLEDKGYIFHNLKRQTNLFRKELFKHTATQMKMMEDMGSANYHNHFQKDFDKVYEFLVKAKPAQITMLSKILEENEELSTLTEEKLIKMIENGDIIVEPETIGRSELEKQSN